MNGTMYYHYLRGQGYRPKTAAMCCIIRFSKDMDEVFIRGNRVKKRELSSSGDIVCKVGGPYAKDKDL